MKYLGMDYGAKRVGIAVSDEGGRIAFPRATLPNDETLLRQLAEIIRKEKIGAIVIGDTRSHGGAENPVTPEADAFATALTQEMALPVERVWEAWSSIEASRYSPGEKGHDDASAAAIILQRYLDIHSNTVE